MAADGSQREKINRTYELTGGELEVPTTLLLILRDSLRSVLMRWNSFTMLYLHPRKQTKNHIKSLLHTEHAIVAVVTRCTKLLTTYHHYVFFMYASPVFG